MPDPLTENPLIASFFSADPGGPGLTLEQLKARRAIAAALAAKSRDYPNTIGKGIFSVGESIGEGIRDYKLSQSERQMIARDAATAKKNADVFEASPPVVKTPPSGAEDPRAGTSPRAELDPETNLSRAQMAEALMGGAQGSQPAGPAGIQMASLGGTMSDAGQPGLTYGGPSPAGPGASMAERPDQAPPAPSVPPPGMAGQIPGGTPGPQPVAGGGVPQDGRMPLPAPPPEGRMPLPGGSPEGRMPLPAPPPGQRMPLPGPGQRMPLGGASLDPAVDAARAGMAQQIAGENQAFNPDAAGPAPPGGGVPPQMVAQVGGFGGGPAGGAAPAPVLPTGPGGGVPGQPTVQPARPGSPGVPVTPGGALPDTSQFTPMFEAQATKRFGPPQTLPSPWVNPELREKYNRAIAISTNPYTGEGLRTQAVNAAARIKEENDRLHVEQTGLAKEKITRRDRLIDEENKRLYDEHLSKTDPVKIAEKNQAIVDNQIQLRAGAPAPEVRKAMSDEQTSVRKTAERMQDFTMALDAMNKGVFIGAGANTRLDLAKWGAWATQNKQLAERAGSTELLKAKLLSTVGELVKDLKPVSGYETAMGKAQAGEITMEKPAIEALLRQQLQRGYQHMADYDQKAQSIFKGLGERDPNTGTTTLEARYRSPEANWFNNQHLPRFFEGAAGPNAQAHMADFDQRYGPGAAAFVLQRKQLNPGAR